jgi:hypothetical protein
LVFVIDNERNVTGQFVQGKYESTVDEVEKDSGVLKEPCGTECPLL